MATWTLIPCLATLRAEFNTVAPSRDKGADGSIGDSSHTSTSDHTPDEDSSALRNKDSDRVNEVHALDIDSTGPWPAGRSFRSIVLGVIASERAKWLSPTDVCRLEYVIFDRKIYSRQRDFEPVAYTGSDPHTNHAHFSGRYIAEAERDTRPWGVLPLPSKEDDEMDAAAFFASAAKAARGDADATADDRTNRNNAVQVLRFALGLAVDQQVTANLPCGEEGLLQAIADRLPKIEAGLAEVKAQTAPAPK